MVGQPADFLLLDLKADLGPAEHNLDIGPQSLEQAHQLRGFDHVPDIDSQADDLGLQRQQRFHHACGGLADDKLAQLRLGPQAGAAVPVHVGQQAAQAQRGVDVFGIERGQHNARAAPRGRGGGIRRSAVHAGIIKP